MSLSRNISETLTQIADKILRSTPRLLSLANLLLAVTYLLHSTVVTLFLGEGAENQGHRTAPNTPPDPRHPSLRSEESVRPHLLVFIVGGENDLGGIFYSNSAVL